MEPIRRTLLENLARDVGFDRVAREHNAWLVVGSSYFSEDAFDGGWINFDDTRQVLVTGQIGVVALSHMGVDITLCPSKIEPKHLPYLALHRRYVFRGYGHG